MTEFVPEPNVQQVAEAYSLDAVDFANTAFGITLDWSDQSVEEVEYMLSRMHEQMATAQPGEEKIQQFAKLFGSYVGEVFRRNHGATWGLFTLDGHTMPALQSESAGVFWPWGRAQNRLEDGPSDNIWHYYQLLLERSGVVVEAAPAPAPVSKTWWTRLLGR